MTQAQNDKLLAALKRKPMTATEIWGELGIARAAARVHDLRAEGYDIRSEPAVVRNRDNQSCRVARYSLAAQQTTLIPAHPGRGVMTQ